MLGRECCSLLTRMREITIQSASDTVGEKEREYLDLEFQQLSNEIERIAQSTSFNGVGLIRGNNDIGVMDFQVGIHSGAEHVISWDSNENDATISGLGVSGLDVVEKDNAKDAIEDIDGAIDKVSGYRASLGAVQTRLQSTINNLDVQTENLSAANSRIRDTDIAVQSAELAKNNILESSSTSVLAQANSMGSAALKLV